MKSLKSKLNELGLLVDRKKYIFTVIKPGFLNIGQKIIERFEEDGWKVSKMRTKQLLLSEARLLYSVHKKEDFYKDLCIYMSSGPSTAIIFTKDDLMDNDIFKEVSEIKDEIRKEYGESDMRNVLHSSDSLEHMEVEQVIYF